MLQNDTEQTSGAQSVTAVFLSVLKHFDTVNIRKAISNILTLLAFWIYLSSIERHTKRSPNMRRGMASRCYDVTKRPGEESWESEFNTESAHFLTLLFFLHKHRTALIKLLFFNLIISLVWMCITIFNIQHFAKTQAIY